MRKREKSVRRRVAVWTIAGIAAAVFATPFAVAASRHPTLSQPRGASPSEDISNAIEKEQAALDWLDHAPPHINDARRRLAEGMMSLEYASSFADYPVWSLLNSAGHRDEEAQTIPASLWPKSKIAEKIEAALVLKRKALKLERAKDAGRPKAAPSATPSRPRRESPRSGSPAASPQSAR